jgi:hypothetical protein
MQGQLFADVKAFHADGTTYIVVMGCPHVMTVHVNNIFTSDGDSIIGFIFLPHPIGKQIIHHTEVHMDRSILDAIILHFATFKRVPKPV